MEIIINAFKLAVMKNYVNFSGRANRTEYWYFILASFLLAIVINVIAAILPDSIGWILPVVLNLALLLPSIAAGIRRLHDINKSGWFMLICLIPLVGLYLIYLLAQPSDSGSNNYGEPSNNLY